MGDPFIPRIGDVVLALGRGETEDRIVVGFPARNGTTGVLVGDKSVGERGFL